MIENKRILITGGSGFLGHHILPLLSGAKTIIERKEYDIRYKSITKTVFESYKPQIVIHLAARVGGIQFNQAQPATLFFDNISMGINMIDCAKECGVEKFVCIGTVCSYPRTPKVPFNENDLWNGYPEDTNAPYGIAKKALLTMCQSYRQQYGLNSIFLMPTNLYGEHDTFTDEQGHVIPMLIKRFVNAKEKNLPSVTVWGSGSATREFMYAGDAAKMIIKATETYNSPEPMNIGTGHETSIKELARTISKIVKYEGEIVWDKSKPDGQPRRSLDVNRMKRNLGIIDFVPLEVGLKKTIEWYKENR